MEEINFLNASGRIGRGAFALRVVLLAALAAAITWYALDFFSHWHHGTFLPLGYFTGIVAALFCGLCAFMQLIKRLHDTGKPPYHALLLLVPGVNVLFILYLMAAPAPEAGSSAG